MTKVRGRVWKFDDNVDTNALAPAVGSRSFNYKLCLKTLRAEFPENVKPGDIVVFGRNAGCGSRREAGGATNLKTLGVGGVLADSAARTHLRGCISVGLPILTYDGVSKIFRDGDTAEFDVETGEIKNVTTGRTVRAQRLPEVLLEVLNAGGAVAMAVARLKQESKVS